MSTTTVRDASEYESRLQQYYFERAEEARAVRVGEKEVSEQAAIVARYREDHHLKPLAIEANRRKLVTALASQLHDASDLHLEDWQLPRIEQEIGWALSQGFNGALYAKNARRLRRDAPLAPSPTVRTARSRRA